MATTLDVTLTLDFECSDKVLTVTDTTDYASAGTSRADVKVNYTLTHKPSSGDVAISLTYNEDTATGFDVTLLNSGWHRINVSTVQDTENVKLGVTGTVNVTNGVTTVVGVGTLFLTEFSVGDGIQIGGVLYEVGGVSTNTSLTLTQVYAGATDTGITPYRVPLFNGVLEYDFFVQCAYEACINEKLFNISKNTSCGCEPSKKVYEYHLLKAMNEAAEYIFTRTQDYSQAQKIGESIELMCGSNCCG